MYVDMGVHSQLTRPLLSPRQVMNSFLDFVREPKALDQFQHSTSLLRTLRHAQVLVHLSEAHNSQSNVTVVL